MFRLKKQSFDVYSHRGAVVTVCYNAQPFIERTLRSVLSPNYLNMEHIIVDGGLKDGIVDLMKNIGLDLAYRVAADGRFFKTVKDLGQKFGHRPVFVANYDNFGGVSSLNWIRVFKEYAKMRGIRPFSPLWIVMYLRYFARTLLSRFLLRRGDMYLCSRSMNRSWRVSEEKIQDE